MGTATGLDGSFLGVGFGGHSSASTCFWRVAGVLGAVEVWELPDGEDELKVDSGLEWVPFGPIVDPCAWMTLASGDEAADLCWC